MDLHVTAVDWLEPEGARLRRLQQEEGHEGTAPEAGDPAGDGAGDPGTTSVPDVAVFLLGRDRLTGAAVACGGLQPAAPGVAEIRRLYVVPQYRDHGVSRILLTELEREAAALGWLVLRAEAHDHRTGTAALYADAGYRLVPETGEEPPHFERRLN